MCCINEYNTLLNALASSNSADSSISSLDKPCFLCAMMNDWQEIIMNYPDTSLLPDDKH